MISSVGVSSDCNNSPQRSRYEHRWEGAWPESNRRQIIDY